MVGSMVRDHASMPPARDWAFSKPCWRSHMVTLRERGSVVAEDEDGFVGVEFGVGAGGDVAHGHEEGVFDVGGVELPLLADVDEDGRVGLLEEGGGGLGGDLGGKHGYRIASGAMPGRGVTVVREGLRGRWMDGQGCRWID